MFLGLTRQMLGEDHCLWPHVGGGMRKIRMEGFGGLPDNILLGIAEINALSPWKAASLTVLQNAGPSWQNYRTDFTWPISGGRDSWRGGSKQTTIRDPRRKGNK